MWSNTSLKVIELITWSQTKLNHFVILLDRQRTIEYFSFNVLNLILAYMPNTTQLSKLHHSSFEHDHRSLKFNLESLWCISHSVEYERLEHETPQGCHNGRIIPRNLSDRLLRHKLGRSWASDVACRTPRCRNAGSRNEVHGPLDTWIQVLISFLDSCKV